MARKKQVTNIIGLDTTFYRELLRFYQSNKGTIRSHYHVLTRTLLDYNDPDKPRKGQFLRRPQFEALEMYIFLKEYTKHRPVHELFTDWYLRQNGFEKRGNVLGIDGREQGVLAEELIFNKDAYETIFKKMEAAKQIYPNYIFALTMGVGKTLLMATCIAYEFVLAEKFPKDELYCQNALIFAPDKTVLQSLREIETFDFEKVLPPAHANWLETNRRWHYLDESGVSLGALNGSKYNLIISNTQKIILKKKNKKADPATLLYAESFKANISKGIYAEFADLQTFDDPEDAQELTVNQRFQTLSKIPQLGIFVDEAHHAFGAKLKDNLMDVKKDTSLRFTINALARSIESKGSKMVACYNFTGTPYIKNEVLPEVVYSYSLDSAIYNSYLKSIKLHGYSNPRGVDFVRAVVDEFLKKYGDKKVEGMLPKLAFFATDIEDANTNLRPLLEKILGEHGISSHSILINVGDEKITTNDDIKAFNELDTKHSEKQFIILVNKGKEGWNCRSLCGVAMFRRPRSKVFVLQASMRCLRAIGKEQEEGQVYLSEENIEILNDELQQNFRLNTDDLQRSKSDKNAYEVRVLKQKKIEIMRRRHLYQTQEKVLKEKVAFNMDQWDVEKYKLLHVEYGAKLHARQKIQQVSSEDKSHLKERREWSAYTLTAEIARYLCASPIRIGKILRESAEGMDALVAIVNEHNELLYDKVIPALFDALYEISHFESNEKVELDLVREPDGGFYTIHGDPEKTQLFNDWLDRNKKDAEKSFHLDTYCFDSKPEQEFFKTIISQDEVQEVYFTGMLTHGQSDFCINYIDPDTKGVRSYYPDFLVLTTSGEWLVIEIKAANMTKDPIVEAKKDFAETMLKASNMQYKMIPHDCVASGLNYIPQQQSSLSN